MIEKYPPKIWKLISGNCGERKPSSTNKRRDKSFSMESHDLYESLLNYRHLNVAFLTTSRMVFLNCWAIRTQNKARVMCNKIFKTLKGNCFPCLCEWLLWKPPRVRPLKLLLWSVFNIIMERRAFFTFLLIQVCFLFRRSLVRKSCLNIQLLIKKYFIKTQIYSVCPPMETLLCGTHSRFHECRQSTRLQPSPSVRLKKKKKLFGT